MDYQTLREWIDADPFTPFRIMMTDGRAIEVHHPSLLWPGRNTAMLGIPDNPAEPEVPSRRVTLSMLQILRVEPLGTDVTVGR